jgi:hypothetical protein
MDEAIKNPHDQVRRGEIAGGGYWGGLVADRIPADWGTCLFEHHGLSALITQKPDQL